MKKHATLWKIQSKDQSGQMTVLVTGRNLIDVAMNAVNFVGKLPGGMIQERTEALALALGTSAESAIGLTLTKGG